MPVPKRKRSRARRDSRFADKGLEVKAFGLCTQCKDPIVPHQVCRSCGYYKGVKVLKTKNDRLVKRVEVAHKKKARVQSKVEQAKKSSQTEE